MGGKKKAVQQPRVKGNSKPSSSDKAARFLVQQTGGLETPLTNFLSTKPRSFLLDIDTSKVEGCQRRLSSFVPYARIQMLWFGCECFQYFKTMEKRDSVTKQKALREFCEILKPELDNNDNNVLMMNSILSVLPFWPRIYYRLSFDGDRKVRELVQSTMHALASRVGSDTILCVKQVIPMWTCSTVDTHESAASLAMRGLSDIFPGKKLSAAYCLCAEELLDLVETQLSDLGCFKFTDTKSYSRSKHSLDSRNNSVQNDGNNTANANTESYSSYSCDLSLILRFIALFVSDLIHLPADNKQLIRLKSLLSPEDIWSRVTHGLEAMSHEKNNSCLYRTYGTPSSLYIAVYKLCSVLCRSPIWCEWMKETSDGKVLGEYICNITVGHLGANCEQAGKTGTDKLLRFPAPRDVSADVYSSLWDAALSCLAGLSGKFVWSVIDWHQTFVTRLESLLSHSEKSQTKQAYTHLLCLLNEFPLDYSNLTSCELGILNKVFIEATLSGLQRSLLILMPVLNSGCSESGYTLSDDPDTPVYIVTGILESVRYLIDRLLTPMDDEKGTSRTALSRQSYLNVVFSQIAKFCNNLAQSNHCLKSSMYDELKSSIYHWISVDESEEFIPPINDECRVNRLLIGLTDPLRLISFMDSLARSSNQRMNKYFLDNSKMPTKKIDNNVDQCVVTLTVQADWCINLFRCIGDILLNNMAERIPKESSTRSFYILLFLCIYGHLPLKCFTVPCILQEVFSSLLPKLPHEVHCICWSHPVIYGLVKSWALSTENIENELNIPMNSSVCLIFTNDILPILMQSLPCLQKMFDSAGVSTKLLSNRISETLCFWARVWFNKISGTEHVVPNTIVINAYMNNLHSLLTSCLHNNKSICKSHREVNSNRNLSEAVIIPIQLVDTLSNCLKQRFENLLSSDYPFYSNNDNNNNKIDATELRIAGSLLIHLLQEVGNDDDDSLCNSSALSQLYLLLTKILLFLYNLSVLSEVSKTPPIGTEHRDGCAQNDDDDINEYTETVFTFKELIHRSEGVILNRLNYERRQIGMKKASLIS
ncbi:unnamed protein product [Heterobilharzia americana]|nr:unnamed protein product [Heterobilharzia americana]